MTVNKVSVTQLSWIALFPKQEFYKTKATFITQERL